MICLHIAEQILLPIFTLFAPCTPILGSPGTIPGRFTLLSQCNPTHIPGCEGTLDTDRPRGVGYIVLATSERN
jgi:hypothetical protein